MTDMVNSPPHYGIGDTGLEACDVVRPLMTEQEWEKHCLATALYYLLRLGRKDDPAQDAAKAIWWLTWIAKGDPRKVDAQPPADDLNKVLTAMVEDVLVHGKAVYRVDPSAIQEAAASPAPSASSAAAPSGSPARSA